MVSFGMVGEVVCLYIVALLYVTCCILYAQAAKEMNRSFVGYLVLGILGTPALSALLLVALGYRKK